MNDFLHKLRNSNQNEKRYLKNRRQVDRGYYDSKDRRNGNDRRDIDPQPDKFKKPFHQNYKKGNPRGEEQNEAIIKLLTIIADSQSQMADIGERRAIAEEQKAQAFKDIAESLNQLLKATPANPIQLAQHQNDHQTNDTFEIANEEERQKAISIIMDMREQDSTYGEIAEELEKASLPTFSGKGRWHAQTVHRIFRQNHQTN